MAKAADYNLGPNTFPRGWFIVAESSELDKGPMAVRYFGQDLALYRGQSGKPVMLDAYCAHMGTHLTASTSAIQGSSRPVMPNACCWISKSCKRKTPTSCAIRARFTRWRGNSARVERVRSRAHAAEDRAAAQHFVSVVEDRGLTGRDRPLRGVEDEAGAAVRQRRDRRRRCRCAIPDLRVYAQIVVRR